MTLPRLSLLTHVAVAGTLITAPVAAQTVIIATNSPGSIQYASGAAVAKVLVLNAGIKARIQPSGGSSNYIPMLNRGETSFGFANGLEALFAYNGTGTFSGRPNKNLRLVGLVFPLYLSLLVPADSPAKTVSDVKGLRIGGVFTSQTIMTYVQDALLANGGLTIKEMKVIPVPTANRGTQDEAEGRVDVSTCPPGGAICTQADAALSSKGGARFLSLNDNSAAVERMRKFLPSAWVQKIDPAKAMAGIVGPTNVMAYPYYLVASAKTPEDLVYRVVKTLRNNKAELAKSFAVFKRFDPADMAHKSQIPYHSGAIRYYKEIGIWKK